MPNDNEINETEELLNAVIPDEQERAPEVRAETRPPVQAVKSSKERAAERAADREAGRSSVLDALNKQAQSKGFESVEEMLKSTSGTPKPRPMDKSAADVELKRENEDLRREITGYKRTIQGLRSRIDVLENDGALRQLAYEADIQGDDIDYALTQLQSHYKKLPSEATKDFDPGKYLREDLKTKKPGIFRQALAAKEAAKAVEEVDVSTVPTGRAPKGASTKEVQASEADQTRPKRAGDMSKDEYREHLRKLGYRDPASMV